MVALKRPHRDDPVAIERLLREARVGGLLRHEAIVATLDVERDEDGWFLVLEYVDGPTLSAVLAHAAAHDTHLPVGVAFDLVEALLSALAYAHGVRDEAGQPLQLVHGDLSPANVLLTQKGQLKVADFGGASSTVSAARSEGRGTPGFGAPEVARGEPLDVRADVYSAGAIARALFERTELHDAAALLAVLRRATAAEREARFPDIASFAAALSPWRPLAPGDSTLESLASGWVTQLATQPASAATDESAPALPARPYRGLDSFGTDSAALFFGRRDDARRLARRIRACPIVVLTGASGAGKSSLLAAGMPEHLADFAVLRFRPGPDPSTRLARVLGVSREELAVAHTRSPLSAPTLLIIDQAEELLTLASPAAALEACAALTSLVVDGTTRLVFSVRADHLAALCDLEPLRGVVSVELLSLPSRQQLADALEKPLEPFGYRFESPELVERIVSSLIGSPGALALLQFTADQLWDRRDQAQAVLRAADLEALGGVEGAITTYADRVLEALAPAEQQVARRILVRCLQDGARRPLAVPALLAAEWAGGHASEVLERLVEARLLTRRADPEEGAVVEPAHEALAAHWGTLARWVTEDSLAHQLLGELMRATERWARDRRDELLWSSAWLARWGLLSAELDEHLGAGERYFIEASTRHARRSRRRRIIAVATVTSGLLVLVLFATWGWRQAAGAREEAELARRAAEHEALLSRSAEHRERGETGEAVALAREVLRQEPRSVRAIAELYAAVGGRAERAILTGHGDTVRDAAFTPDGEYMLTVGMDGFVRIWDREGRPARTLEPALGPLYWVRLSSRPDRFLVVGAAGAALYEPGGELIAKLALEQQPVLASWDAAGERLLVTGERGEAVVFDGSGAIRHVLAPGTDHPLWGVISPDGARVALVPTSPGRGTISTVDGRPLAELALQGDPAWAVFSPDPARDRLLVAGWPGRAQLFDGQGRELAAVVGRGRYPAVAWAQSGAHFYAGSPDDEGALLVMSADGERLGTLAGHLAPIHAVVTGVGGIVASADERGQVRVFSAAGETLAVLDGHAGRVWSLAFSPSGASLLSAAEDGTARLWDTLGRSRARLMPGRFVERCPIDPWGERVLALSQDPQESVHAWSELRFFTVGGDLLATHRAEGEAQVADVRWRPDGREAAALRRDGAVDWFDRDGRALGTRRVAGKVKALAWQGEALVGGTTDGRVFSLERSGDEAVLQVLEGPVKALAMSRERGVAGGEGGLAVFERSSVSQVDPRPGVNAACWSPDGTRFAVGRESGEAEIRDAAGRLLATLVGHRERVVQCEWHPSSARVATAAWDGEARVWSADGALIEVLGGNRREVGAAMWSPDGARLLTTDWSGVAALRDERGVLARLSGHGGEVLRATFAVHAPLIATCGRNGRSIHLWPADDHALMAWADALVPNVTETSPWLD